MASKSPIVPLPPSPSGETVTVKLINSVNFGPLIVPRFMGPDVPGVMELPGGPSFSFLLEHSSGRKLVYDLGIRKDWHNLAPDIANYIPTTVYKFEMDKNVIDILEENGVQGKDIEAVIWSHWHWDHIGDPSTFPPTTDLIVGPGFKEAMLPGAPANPRSHIRESDYEGRNLREITCQGDGSLTIGKFNAFDYFGDGSFYLVDTPGHAVGHLCGLARTTTGTNEPDTFIWLGGDICHHGGEIRPSQYLPVPDSITLHPCHPLDLGRSFCPGGAWVELQKIRDREPTQTLFDLRFGQDIPLATKTIGHFQEIDCDENIFVIISHDRAVRDVVDHFPASLNDWKAKGWGKMTKWTWLGDLQPFFKAQGVME